MSVTRFAPIDTSKRQLRENKRLSAAGQCWKLAVRRPAVELFFQDLAWHRKVYRQLGDLPQDRSRRVGLVEPDLRARRIQQGRLQRQGAIYSRRVGLVDAGSPS